MAPGTERAIASMHFSATGVRSVISSTRTPPSTSACAIGIASSSDWITITGITGPWSASSRVFIAASSLVKARCRRPLRR
jgi:hypothetical protein